MPDLYDWAAEGHLMPKEPVTRMACKDCLKVFVRPRVQTWDVMFLAGCGEHEGWEPEGGPE